MTTKAMRACAALIVFFCANVLAEVLPIESSIRFLNKDQASEVMAGPTAEGYFSALAVPEMMAKTGLDLRFKHPLEAQATARNHYATETLDFTADEMQVLRWAIDRMQPTLSQKAPLFARTPWTFLKVSDKIEGGLPHTRAAAIVLPSAFLTKLIAPYLGGKVFERGDFLTELLIHEQTHVLQRSHPALFDALVTQVFGFERMSSPVYKAWLKERGVVNPDAPNSEWVYPLGSVAGAASTTGVLPYLLLSNLSAPRMPRDFQMVGVNMAKLDSEWTVVETNEVPVVQALWEAKEYLQAFPNKNEVYHPYEIAADMVGYWLSGRNDAPLPLHPMREKLVEWAQRNLQ